VIRLIRSELLKIRTTNGWWLFAIAVLAATVLAFLSHVLSAHAQLNPPDLIDAVGDTGLTPEERQQVRDDLAAQAEQTRSATGLAGLATGIYTSGQFFGLLLVMLLGVVAVTAEFFHQTATTTFLATPRRTRVILAKSGAVVLVALAFWAVGTVLSVVGGVVFFAYEGVGNSLDRSDVLTTMLLNGLAYALWAVLGLGIGALLRTHIAAVVTGTVLYMASIPTAFVVFGTLHSIIKQDWVLTAAVSVPAVASLVMTSSGRLWEQSPDRWVGAVVLLGYGVVATAVGAVITRRRDIA
jgi:ABC-type transport system involved in multi-copper enzyme maturation permease subunit